MIRPPILVPPNPMKRYTPVPEPVRKRNTFVTVGVAFRCNDGFVLGADTQMSHGAANQDNAFAHYEPKIFDCDGRHFHAACVGSGDGSLLRPFVGQFLENLTNEDDEHEGINLGVTKSVLEATCLDFQSQTGAIPDLHLIVAAVGEGRKTRFLRTAGLVVTDPAKPWEVVGIGENALVYFLIEELYHPDLSLRQLAVLTAFVIYAAKRFSPQYCGGETNIHILERENFSGYSLTKPEVNSLEQAFIQGAATHLRELLDKTAKEITWKP